MEKSQERLKEAMGTLTDDQKKMFGRLETHLSVLINRWCDMDEFEVFQDYVAYNASLQQQNKQLIEALKTVYGIASETFESHNQLELIRLTAAEHLQGGEEE